MIRQHKKFPPTARSPGKPDHQVGDSAANFGTLSSGSITNSMLFTVFDTYLTLRSPGAWVRAKTFLILKVAP